MSQKPLYLKIAHIVRVVCVPPVMVGILLVLLFVLREDVFAGLTEMVVSLLGLTVLPVLAYPVSAIIPALRKKGFGDDVPKRVLGRQP